MAQEGETHRLSWFALVFLTENTRERMRKDNEKRKNRKSRRKCQTEDVSLMYVELARARKREPHRKGAGEKATKTQGKKRRSEDATCMSSLSSVFPFFFLFLFTKRAHINVVETILLPHLSLNTKGERDEKKERETKQRKRVVS